MRRLKFWFVIIAVVSMVGAGAAVATHKKSKTHTDAVATTLGPATPSAVKTRTWTGQDGNYTKFHGRWTGNANSSDPRLKGTLTVHASGVINTSSTPPAGQVTGWLRIRGDKNGAKARFWAVYSGAAGQLNGFVVGSVHDKTGSTNEEQSGSGRLLGTLTGTFPSGGTFNATITPANIQGWRHHRKH
jgi:hypothetical protein